MKSCGPEHPEHSGTAEDKCKAHAAQSTQSIVGDKWSTSSGRQGENCIFFRTLGGSWGDTCKIMRPEKPRKSRKTSGKHAGDKYKNMRPKVPRAYREVRGNCQRQVQNHAGQSTQSILGDKQRTSIKLTAQSIQSIAGDKWGAHVKPCGPGTSEDTGRQGGNKCKIMRRRAPTA